MSKLEKNSLGKVIKNETFSGYFACFSAWLFRDVNQFEYFLMNLDLSQTFARKLNIAKQE